MNERKRPPNHAPSLIVTFLMAWVLVGIPACIAKYSLDSLKWQRPNLDIIER